MFFLVAWLKWTLSPLVISLLEIRQKNYSLYKPRNERWNVFQKRDFVVSMSNSKINFLELSSSFIIFAAPWMIVKLSRGTCMFKIRKHMRLYIGFLSVIIEFTFSRYNFV